MGAALETSAPPGATPSFKTRLKAWWEGYDPADLMAEALPVEPVLVTATPAEAPPAEVPPLEQPHIKVAQQIWGEGFMRPGGAAAILTLVKPFAINPSMTVMEFGAGLGGGTRAVSAEFDVWVHGFEPDPILAAGGHELTVVVHDDLAVGLGRIGHDQNLRHRLPPLVVLPRGWRPNLGTR